MEPGHAGANGILRFARHTGIGHFLDKEPLMLGIGIPVEAVTLGRRLLDDVVDVKSPAEKHKAGNKSVLWLAAPIDNFLLGLVGSRLLNDEPEGQPSPPKCHWPSRK